MLTPKCNVCGASLRRVETRTVAEHPLVGPQMTYVEERLTCVAGHTVLRLRNDAYRPALSPQRG